MADIHGFLDTLVRLQLQFNCIAEESGVDDGQKAPIDLVEYRSKYYEYTITAMLQAVGVSTEKLGFLLGSSYKKTPEYIVDVMLWSIVSEHEAKKAGAMVVKQSGNSPPVGSLPDSPGAGRGVLEQKKRKKGEEGGRRRRSSSRRTSDRVTLRLEEHSLPTRQSPPSKQRQRTNSPLDIDPYPPTPTEQ